jgi:MFS family permease
MSRMERWIVVVLAAVSVVVRALAFFRYRFDSDEPQHLHVAWGWTAGLLQYRDVFDNHAPLFHMLTAPLLAMVGERPTVLFYMRLPMIVLWAVVLWATFVVARRLYDTRIAVWSALLLALVPTFFLKSLEYRTDNLWNAFWMLAVVALLWERFFAAGLLLGLAMATSMKTPLLIVTLLLAALITRTWRRGWLLLVLGSLIPPALIALYFWQRGAWASVVYCVIKYSEEVAATWDPLAIWLRRAFWVPAMIIVVVLSRRRETTRDFWGVATAVFFINLASFWILLSPRDVLPFLPFLVIFVVAAWRARPALLAGTAVVLLALIVYYANGFRNGTREYTTMMNQVLRLTRPGESLMDLKGETVYRRRPYYYIFEAIGRRVLRRHMIPDNVPEAIVAARCYVTQADGPFFSTRTQDFLREHFLDMGRLRAAGSLVHGDGTFTIAVPGDYVVVRHAGQASGTLDGTRYTGPRTLAAGPHHFIRDAGGEVVAVLWAPAFQRGFSPFHLQDRDF